MPAAEMTMYQMTLKGARQTEIVALVASDQPARQARAAVRSLDDPYYGRPRRIRIVRALPVLPNGKVDRHRIEQLFAAPHRPKAAEGLTDRAPLSPPPHL